jgi:L-ascorbate metabolism protein UlaG (beta-lactamase superfamily)
VLASSSKGNCYIYGAIMVDIGVSFDLVYKYLSNIKYLCITHLHGDHLNIATLLKIMQYNKKIKVITNEQVYNKLMHIASFNRLIRIKNNQTLKIKGIGTVKRVDVPHEPLTCSSFAFDFNGTKIGHVTDCGDISHLNWLNFDYATIELNYEEEKINANYLKAVDESDYFMIKHLKRVKLTHLANFQHHDFVKKNKIKEVFKAHGSSRNKEIE